MEIGILSDTHNDRENLKQALAVFRQHAVITLIHCGDMTSGEMAGMFAGFRVIHVHGNMDQAANPIRRVLLALNPDNVSVPFYRGQLDGVWVAAVHGHRAEQLDALVRDGRLSFVFHGHTHRRRDETIGRTRVINPGALGGTRHEERSVCLVDLFQKQVRFITLP